MVLYSEKCRRVIETKRVERKRYAHLAKLAKIAKVVKRVSKTIQQNGQVTERAT